MHRRIFICAILGLSIFATASAADFAIKSKAFLNTQKIPTKYSCDGNNIPPELTWTDVPSNTKSFALILYSPDAVIRVPFYNWVLFNIPGDAKGIAEGGRLPEGTIIGNNSLGEARYSGPCPPDSFTHHYFFTLYALDKNLYLSEGAEIDDILSEIRDHVIKQTELGGTFSH